MHFRAVMCKSENTENSNAQSGRQKSAPTETSFSVDEEKWERAMMFSGKA